MIRQKMASRGHAHIALVIILAAIPPLCGCAVPDVAPFADATVALRESVAQSSLTTLGAVADSEADASTIESLKALQATRMEAADALVEYADALAGIVAAGQSARQSVEALSGTVGRLASYFPGAGPVPAEVTTLINVIGSTALEIKAAHDLGEAVDAAHPAVVGIADLLVKELDDLELLYEMASQDREAAVDDRFALDNDYRAKLVAIRSERRSKLVAALDADDPAQIGAATASVKEIESLLAETDEQRRLYREAMDAVLAERADVKELFRRARQAARAWATAHASLRAAIETNRQMNLRLLLSKVQEVRDAVAALQHAESRPSGGS